MIVLKSPAEIDRMREAGRLVAMAHQTVAGMIVPGRSLAELDAVIERLYKDHAAEAVFHEFSSSQGRYPAASSISVNEQVAHSVPTDRRLEAGDIVSVDTGCRLGGWCADAAWTYHVGPLDPLRQRLLRVGEDLLKAAIRGLSACRFWSEIAAEMLAGANRAGFSLVEEFAGHGIGREMHEDPRLPIVAGAGEIPLEPGLVLAIEPVINAGGRHIRPAGDGWSLVTADGAPSVHFEHTVALREDGPEVLTAGIGGSL